MSVIYCNINLFDYDQKIYKKENEKVKEIAKIPMNNLGTFLAKYVNENNINEIHLIGYKDYAVNIKNQIIMNSKTKFNNDNLTIYLEEKGEK